MKKSDNIEWNIMFKVLRNSRTDFRNRRLISHFITLFTIHFHLPLYKNQTDLIDNWNQEL